MHDSGDPLSGQACCAQQVLRGDGTDRCHVMRKSGSFSLPSELSPSNFLIIMSLSQSCFSLVNIIWVMKCLERTAVCLLEVLG